LPQAFTFHSQNTMLGIPLGTLTDSADDNAQAIQLTFLNTLMSQGEIPNLSLTLTDQGLLNTLVQHGAADSGVSPEQYRADLLSRVNNFPLQLPPNMQSVVQPVSAAVASFLGGNSTLQVRLKPEFGGSFAKLQPQIMGAMFSGEIKQVVNLLHLEIENIAH
jgi:hypothetical protein